MLDSPITLLPPILAIIIAVWRRNALFALFCGVILCCLIAAGGNPIETLRLTFTYFLGVFSSLGNIYIVSFALLIGALVALFNSSGAVNGFIKHLSDMKLVSSSRQARLLPTVIGTSIFTDTNLSMFTSGMASQKVFDQHKISRAKLAYLLDSTCAPISILFLVNGWGAYVLGLLDGYELSDPVGVLIGTITYNAYAIIAVLLAYFTAYTGKAYGPMKSAKSLVPNIENTETTIHKVAPAKVMWIPLICLLVFTFTLLWITGDGDIRRGSGSFSVFWSIVSSLVILILLILGHRLLSAKQVITDSISGIKSMIIPVAILVLSFAFGDAIKALGTGQYVSQLLNVEVPMFLMAPILFIAAGIMAFSTGTSWGTFAILIPIAVPIAQQSGLPVEFLVAAVLGGAIFGDHASPISDTTVVASIAWL